MNIQVTITRADFLELNKAVLFRNRIRSGFIIATSFIAVWLIILNKNKPINVSSILIQAILFYIAWGIFMFIIHQFTIWQIKKHPEKDGSILGEKNYNLGEDGIRETTNSSESLVKWSGIKRFEETENYVFVYVDKIAAYIFPKRAFSGSQQLDSFLEILNEKIN